MTKKNEIVKKQGGVSSSSTWRGATVAPTTGSGGASPACTPAWVWTRLGRSSQVRLRERPASMVTRGFRGNAPETQRTQTTFDAYNCSAFFPAGTMNSLYLLYLGKVEKVWLPEKIFSVLTYYGQVANTT